MDKHPRDSNTNAASTYYLKNVEDRYVFNRSSGLYEPKPANTTRNSKTNSADSYRKSPFKLDIKRDWLTLLISVGSLVLFGTTIHYARLQWETMNQTYCEMRKQTEYARTQANTANDAMENTQAFFKTDERAWVEMESVEPVSVPPPATWKGGILVYLRVSFKNYGKTSARNVIVKSNTRGYIVGNLTRDMIVKDFLNVGRLSREPVASIIGPGNDTFIGKGGALIQTPYTAFGKTMAGAYVGRIDYDDIFERHHWYTFCYILNKSAKLIACEYGNDEDQEKAKER